MCPQRVTFDEVVAIVRSMYAAIWCDDQTTRSSRSSRLNADPHNSAFAGCTTRRGGELGPWVKIKEPAFIAERCRNAGLSSDLVQ